MRAGADVRGYYYWSLIDNYEWNLGMHGKTLGLYAVDPLDPRKTRVPRDAAEVYGRIAASNGLPCDILESYSE